MKGKAVTNGTSEYEQNKKHPAIDDPSTIEPVLQPIKISDTRRIGVTIGLMIGMFLGALEATAVSTAMPTVVSSLGGLHIYSWVFSAYILTSTVSLPLWGRLSDLYGRRKFYIIGIVIFLVGSALSGQSNSMTTLILFRALQGFGGGALLTLGMIIVGEMYSLKERAKVQGLFGGVWGLSSLAGPVLGGFITDQFSWRWVFYINIPFGLVAAFVVGFALKELARSEKKVFLDLKGALVLTALVTLLLIGFTQISKENGLSSPVAYILIGSCFPLLWLFITIQKGAKDPILPLQLFKNRFFKTSALTGFFVGMAMFGSISFVPLFIQGVIGTNPTKTGTILTPLLLGWVFFSSISGRLMINLGYRRLMIMGTLILSVGFLLLTTMDSNSTHFEAIFILLILGTGMGIIFVPLLLAVQNSVPRSQLGIATSTTQFFRSMGATVGVSLMGMVMSTFMLYGSSALSRNVEPSAIEYLRSPELIVNPESRINLSPEVLETLTNLLAHSLKYVFVTGFVIALIAFFSSFLMPKGKFVDMREEERNTIKKNS
ncbi:MFS transporter [Desulfobacterota bacterium AH_259_B03_O07]|nr:MFS transporter [Desulfobacterota bacterium AH_259_B03_O07]